MIEIDFEGFFQCRLATDPDAFDHSRGVGGWTFAFGTEPDLDRVIRLQDPVALRSRAPAVGVNVVAATSDNGTDVSSLVGAELRLRDDAVFEGRNGAIAGDTVEPIAPIRLEVKTNDLRIERKSDYDVTNIIQRAPFMGGGLIALPDTSVRVVEISNNAQAESFRATRKTDLEADLASSTDPDEQAILQARIDELAAGGGGAITATLHSAVPYGFPLKDAAVLEIRAGSRLENVIDTGNDWSVSFWMGCWDADSLTGYMRGKMEIPTL